MIALADLLVAVAVAMVVVATVLVVHATKSLEFSNKEGAAFLQRPLSLYGFAHLCGG
jgi:hypothetical protein